MIEVSRTVRILRAQVSCPAGAQLAAQMSPIWGPNGKAICECEIREALMIEGAFNLEC